MRVCVYLPVTYPLGADSDLGPHITLVYSEAATGSVGAFLEAVEAVVDRLPSSVQLTGAVEMFGEDGNVPVALCEAEGLAPMRDEVLQGIETRGCAAPATWDEYRPHITLREALAAVDPGPVAVGAPIVRFTTDDGEVHDYDMGQRGKPISGPHMLAEGPSPVLVAADGTGKPFIALGVGPNTSVLNGQRVASTVTVEHLQEMVRVLDHWREAGTYLPRLDWRHQASPYLGGDSANDPNKGLALGKIVAWRIVDRPDVGPGLEVTPRYNNDGIRIVSGQMSPDGSDSDAWPSAEFVVDQPVFERNGGGQIGTAALFAVAIQPRQQQDDARVSPAMLAEQPPPGGATEEERMDFIRTLMAALPEADQKKIEDAYMAAEGDEDAKVAAAQAEFSACIERMKAPSPAEEPAALAEEEDDFEFLGEKPNGMAQVSALAERLQRLERADAERAAQLASAEAEREFASSGLAPADRPAFMALRAAGNVQGLSEFVQRHKLPNQPERAAVPHVEGLSQSGSGTTILGVDWGKAMQTMNTNGGDLTGAAKRQQEGRA